MEKYILVVDDEPSILDALRYLLEYEGYDVKVSPRGDMVERMPDIPNTYPQLIILDMYLSGMDGRDIVRKLKNSPRTHDIPIVMISAYPNGYYEARKSGADDFIPKPFELEDLLGKVKKYVH